MGKRSDIAVSALTLCLLGAALADRMKFHMPGPDAAPYHQRVREAGARVPYAAGNWAGEDTELPPAAVAMLHPNLVISRHYRNSQTAHLVEFLLIQCSDSRDLIGHYPPRCYPANGYLQVRAPEPQDWQVQGLTIHGTRYEFQPSRLPSGFQWVGTQVVEDFMVLPDGTTCRDLQGIDAAARDRRKKFFGGAHVQVVSDAALLTESEREDAFKQIIAAALPLIEQIGGGVKP